MCMCFIYYAILCVPINTPFLLLPTEDTSPEHVTVNKTLQEEFFQKIFLQLESINRFFRMEESRLIFGFTEIQEQV